jgi:hypothetical protein
MATGSASSAAIRLDVVRDDELDELLSGQRPAEVVAVRDIAAGPG